jgi:aminomethyltransferase
MVEFAGYSMPVQYTNMGLMKEHLYTRNSCGVFDVSHMGQVYVRGSHASEFLERITVVDT